MRLEITRTEGLRNDLVLQIDRSEIQDALLSVANRERLLQLPGIPRHRAATVEEAADLAAARMPLDDHLRQLDVAGPNRAPRRAVVVSNRNLGTNHGHVAWQRNQKPRAFRVPDDGADSSSRSCLCWLRYGTLAITSLRFDFSADRIHDAGTGEDLSDAVEWATFGQQVLRRGRVAQLDEIAGQFYDVRHILAFEPHRAEGEQVRREIYEDYPRALAENVKRAWRRGVPRARYFHNAMGLSSSAVVIVQREGTIEEIGAALRDAGAEDGLILDNGGSVVCWVWWANLYAGGIVSPTVDYRPEGTSMIAFELKGPALLDVPGGSVSPTVV